MTLEEITKEVREICGEWLTEAQIDATAQAIWAVRPDRMGQIGMFGAGAVISWMMTAKMIPGKTGYQLAEITKRTIEEDDEPCGLVN